jgi:hypothetical protein
MMIQVIFFPIWSIVWKLGIAFEIGVVVASASDGGLQERRYQLEKSTAVVITDLGHAVGRLRQVHGELHGALESLEMDSGER